MAYTHRPDLGDLSSPVIPIRKPIKPECIEVSSADEYSRVYEYFRRNKINVILDSLQKERQEKYYFFKLLGDYRILDRKPPHVKIINFEDFRNMVEQS